MGLPENLRGSILSCFIAFFMTNFSSVTPSPVSICEQRQNCNYGENTYGTPNPNGGPRSVRLWRKVPVLTFEFILFDVFVKVKIWQSDTCLLNISCMRLKKANYPSKKNQNRLILLIDCLRAGMTLIKKNYLA